ncbi:alkaline phosphatase family protein [candidate division WOR-3 bacterium]|nr:alkaline phosphatase family protein [candidate division WOR-3 bacterium]
MKKVFIIGLDGGPYKEVKEWIESGELPFLSKLANEGAFGRLKSIIPPYTMLAWPVICTGKNPAKIGPFLYKAKKRGYNPDFFSSSQFINSTDIRTWSIWEWVSHFKGKVGVVNIPMTYPPAKVNGFQITGFFTPKNSDNFTYPPELKEELKGYRIDIELTEGMGLADRKVNKEKLHRDLIELLNERTEWVIKLLQKYPTDLFIINFKEVDNIMHFFWDRKEIVLDYFKMADSSIQKIYNIAKPDYLMIISDHGFSNAPTKFYHINQYLEDRGFLKRAENIKGRLSNFIYKVGIAVVKRFNFIKSLFSERFKVRIARESIKDKIDWKKTKAYAHWYAGIYLNPEYYPDEKSKMKGAEELKELLINAKDPENGNNIFLFVNTKWELFKGPYFNEMPEVIYTTTNDYRLNTNLPGKLIDEKFIRPDLTGHHLGALDGIIFLWGDNIKKGVRVDASIMDVFPTACSLGELPIPEDVDGRILKEALIDGTYKEEFTNIPYTEKETQFLSEEEDKSVKEHLKDLGYL